VHIGGPGLFYWFAPSGASETDAERLTDALRYCCEDINDRIHSGYDPFVVQNVFHDDCPPDDDGEVPADDEPDWLQESENDL